MYENVFISFGLHESPFNVNPDPRYLISTRQIHESWQELTYGVQARKGLMLLTGDAGTGKTTLVNKLLDWLGDRGIPTAFIFNPHLEVSDLFDLVFAEFGIPSSARQDGTAFMCLHRWLLERQRAGEYPVLIVDEAQGLSVQLLEEIRMLANLETPDRKLLQIILSGQPALEEKLNRPELRQLRQRIALRCKTSPLTRDEAHHYVQTRLNLAGAHGKPKFTSESLDAIHLYSSGIPRVMNLLCERTLIKASLAEIDLVPASMIEEAACKYQLHTVKPVNLSEMSVGDADENVTAIEPHFAKARLFPATDSASEQPQAPIGAGSSLGDQEAVRCGNEAGFVSPANREEAPASHRTLDTLVIMGAPARSRAAIHPSEKRDNPQLKSADAVLDQFLSELGRAPRPLAAELIRPGTVFLEPPWVNKLRVARERYDQTIGVLRESFHRGRSGWRPIYGFLSAVSVWQKAAPSMWRRLRQPIVQGGQYASNLFLQNLRFRVGPWEQPSALVPLGPSAASYRIWLSCRDYSLTFLRSLRQHAKASFRWLQQPIGSVKHGHGTGI